MKLMDIKKKETVKELRNLLYQYVKKKYKKGGSDDISYSLLCIAMKIKAAESDYPYSEQEYDKMVEHVRGLI